MLMVVLERVTGREDIGRGEAAPVRLRDERPVEFDFPSPQPGDLHHVLGIPAGGGGAGRLPARRSRASPTRPAVRPTTAPAGRPSAVQCGPDGVRPERRSGPGGSRMRLSRPEGTAVRIGLRTASRQHLLRQLLRLLLRYLLRLLLRDPRRRRRIRAGHPHRTGVVGPLTSPLRPLSPMSLPKVGERDGRDGRCGRSRGSGRARHACASAPPPRRGAGDQESPSPMWSKPRSRCVSSATQPGCAERLAGPLSAGRRCVFPGYGGGPADRAGRTRSDGGRRRVHRGDGRFLSG